jgi:hypothetical protein
MAFTDLRDPDSVSKAIAEFDHRGREGFLTHYGFGKSRDYFLVQNGRFYDSKAIVGAAHGYEFPELGPLRPRDFSGGDSTVRPKLESLGFTVVQLSHTDPRIIEELQRRLHIWRELKNAGGPDGVSPSLIKTLRIHRGEQGIFRDQKVTADLTVGHTGVAVGVLHTGRLYSDDLDEEGLTYHYPVTNRGRRDSNEIASMKACRDLGVPLFVVIKPYPSATTRNVRLGWVEEYKDSIGMLLVTFSDSSVPPSQDFVETVEEAPFLLQQKRKDKRRNTKVRPNQVRFRFHVFKRYGNGCAVCEIRHPNLLEAAHLCPVEYDGSDDARNGLVFCLTHHRAFDKALFKIKPDTFDVIPANYAGRLSEIGITRSSIRHLDLRPHPAALQWAWAQNQKVQVPVTQ